MQNKLDRRYNLKNKMIYALKEDFKDYFPMKFSHRFNLLLNITLLFNETINLTLALKLVVENRI